MNPALNMDRAVAAQLERPLLAENEVVARCPLGLPVVERVAPRLADGSPFPTRYWLSCPLAVKRIGRLEAGGGVRALARHLESDQQAAERMHSANARYAAERDARLDPGSEPRPQGGVAGSSGLGVKCLHAHYADTVAGNDNPVGELVRPFVEPLDCVIPCVVQDEAGWERNPAWRERK